MARFKVQMEIVFFLLVISEMYKHATHDLSVQTCYARPRMRSVLY